MVKRRTLRFLVTFGVLLALVLPTVAALADGTETLGTPSIDIAEGTGYVAAGTGLINQPGEIELNVPDSEIKQVLLYWEGHADCGILDPSTCSGVGQNLTINGNGITGQRIGGPTFFYNLGFGNMYSLSYRADITDLGLVAVGNNSFSITGVSFDAISPTWGTVPGFANGASIVVIYDDGGPKSDLGIRDGNDNAFNNHDSAKGPTGFAPPLDTTVPQEFNFAPEANDRVADLTLLVGSVESPEWQAGPRPNRIVVTINGVATNYDNLLVSGDGPTWDTLTLQVPIPANASSLTVQILSFDDGTQNLPASLSWVAAAFSVAASPVNGAGTGTPGYWMNHPEAWPVSEIEIGGKTYSKEKAIEIMKAPGRGDQTYNMFMHLVAAKLNVLSGTDASCISDTIAAADAWMTTYKLGSNVRGNSAAWKDPGEALKNTLDDYNNGLLCAPSRDSLE